MMDNKEEKKTTDSPEHAMVLPTSYRESTAPDPNDDEGQEHPEQMEGLETIIQSEECPTRTVQIGTKLIAKFRAD
ncbi:hypothetical protein FF1_014604 [Malus domestica]